MGFGGGFSKAFKKVKKGVSKGFKSVKKVGSKAFSMPNKIVSNVVSKVPVVGKPVSDFLQGQGPLGSLEKYLDPGSALMKNFTNDPENFIKNWGGYKDDLQKAYESFKGLGQLIDPDKPPKPEEPPKPDAPDLSNTWKEYSGWMDTARQKRDADISMSRARLYEAGAIPDVITAHEADLRSQYDKKVAEFQGGANYKMLQEGFDIARGAKENPYSKPLAKWTEGQDLPGYFAANYASGSAAADPNEPLYRARRAAAGGNVRPGGGPPQINRAGSGPGGGAGVASPDYAMMPGQTPSASPITPAVSPPTAIAASPSAASVESTAAPTAMAETRRVPNFKGKGIWGGIIKKAMKKNPEAFA